MKEVEAGTLKLIIELWKDTSIVNEKLSLATGRTAIFYCLDMTVPKANMMMDILLKAGADINAVDSDGMTPLHRAFEAESRLVEHMLEKGANPYIRDAR